MPSMISYEFLNSIKNIPNGILGLDSNSVIPFSRFTPNDTRGYLGSFANTTEFNNYLQNNSLKNGSYFFLNNQYLVYNPNNNSYVSISQFTSTWDSALPLNFRKSNIFLITS